MYLLTRRGQKELDKKIKAIRAAIHALSPKDCETFWVRIDEHHYKAYHLKIEQRK
jgi:hypothetical protein